MADLSQTPEDVKLAVTTTHLLVVQVGEAVVQGQPVYFNTSDNKYYLADATDTAAKAVVKGIVMTPASTNGYAAMVESGLDIDLGADLVVGETYVLSGSGAICPIGDLATDDWVTHLGIATATRSLAFSVKVSGVQVPA